MVNPSRVATRLGLTLWMEEDTAAGAVLVTPIILDGRLRGFRRGARRALGGGLLSLEALPFFLPFLVLP